MPIIWWVHRRRDFPEVRSTLPHRIRPPSTWRATRTLLPPARFVIEGFTFEQVMNDDEALKAFIRKAAIGVWHASCSCRMGRPDDPMSVVDTQGRVKGVQGLRVVDASVFPVVPCANTNFPTLMTAEKISAAMTAQ